MPVPGLVKHHPLAPSCFSELEDREDFCSREGGQTGSEIERFALAEPTVVTPVRPREMVSSKDVSLLDNGQSLHRDDR